MKKFIIIILFFINTGNLLAQDPSQKPDKKTVQRMLDWVGIFTMYSDVELSDKVDLGAYGEAADVVGAMVTNNELSVKIAEFKAATYVNIYPKGLTTGEEWIIKKLNDVSNAQYDVLNAPYITLDVLFTSVNQNTGYQISVTLKGSSPITQSLTSATSAINSALAGKTFAKPRDAKETVNQAIFKGLDQLKTVLGEAFVPNMLIQYGDDRYRDGNTIETWQRTGGFIELEVMDKDGVPAVGTITWTNAEPEGNGSKAKYSIGVVGTNTVTVKTDKHQMSLNVKVKEFEVDVRELIKKLLIEILTERKKKAIEELALLRTDSTSNANSIANLIAKLESDNFPMESNGASLTPMFTEPIKLTDTTEFAKSEDRVKSFTALRKRKMILKTILSKLDVIAFAELVVEKPDQLKVLVDDLVKNSGELIAQLIVKQPGKEEEGGRSIVMDYLNKNMERLAGTGPMRTETPAALPTTQPATATATSKKFDPATYLYISSQAHFNGRDQFVKQLSDSLSKWKNLYVFVNYSQDISTDDYLRRTLYTKPKGLPEGARYKIYTLLNIPGSVKETVVSNGNVSTESNAAQAILKDAILEYKEAMIVTEDKNEEVARFIRAISCGRRKQSGEIIVPHGQFTYQVKLSRVIDLLNFGRPSIASKEFNDAVLNVTVFGYGNEGGYLGYKELRLNLGSIVYKAEEKLTISASYGGLIFRFTNVTDPIAKKDAYKWLTSALEKEGAANFTLNNNVVWKVEDARLFSECQLEQLSRSNRIALVNELQDNLYDWKGADDETNHYLFNNVLRTIPPNDRGYFYEQFKNNPKWLLRPYMAMDGQLNKDLMSIILSFWHSQETKEGALAKNRCVIGYSIFGNPQATITNNWPEGTLDFFKDSYDRHPDLAFKAGPFTPVSILTKDSKTAIIVPALVVKFMTDKGRIEDLEDLGWTTANVALFTVGVGEVIAGFRAVSVAAKASEKFILRSVLRLALSSADVLASTASGYCEVADNEDNSFCKTWEEYELYVNLGLLSVTSADLMFMKLKNAYKETSNFSPRQQEIIENELGLGPIVQGKWIPEITDATVFHVLEGEINEFGAAVGCHFKGALDKGTARIRPGAVIEPGPNGMFRVHIDVKDAKGDWVPKKARSSFYPPSWNEEKILSEIQFAFNNRVFDTGNTWNGLSSEGIKIQMYLKADGSNEIISAFPIF